MKYVVIYITRLENAILQVQARFAKQSVSRGVTSASTCKTFSSRVIHKTFSFDNLFKTKYNRIPPPSGGTAILPEYIHYYG
jgi:hypothetical protein